MWLSTNRTKIDRIITFGKGTVFLSLQCTKTIPNEYFDKTDRFVGIVIMLGSNFKLFIEKEIVYLRKQQIRVHVKGSLILLYG